MNSAGVGGGGGGREKEEEGGSDPPTSNLIHFLAAMRGSPQRQRRQSLVADFFRCIVRQDIVIRVCGLSWASGPPPDGQIRGAALSLC